MKRMLTGIKPTGTFPHIGNLMGAMLPLAVQAKEYDTAIFIPDLHALTSIRDGKVLNENIRNGLIAYLAVLGRDTDVTIFRQSDMVGLTKLEWILNCFTPYGLMKRVHSFKTFEQQIDEIKAQTISLKINLKINNDLVESAKLELANIEIQKNETDRLKRRKEITQGLKNIEEQIKMIKEEIKDREKTLMKVTENFHENLNMGTFNYPILMAADIIGYDVDVVPVGKDQLQHLEMARDMARYVNHHYGEEILREPKAIIDDAIAVIPGLDGRKMSKSYNNYISMFEDSATLKKKIAGIPTDDKTLEEPKDPDTCNVFALIKTFGEKKKVEEIRAKYKKGGYGYGHAKQDLHGILDRFIAPYRDAYAELNKLSDEELFEPVRRGNAKMQKRLDEVLERLKKYIGI